MFQKIAKMLGGDPNKKEIEKFSQLVDQINAFEPTLEALSDEALKNKTGEFRKRLAEGETLDDLLAEAFAAVREASKRTTGMRHYDIQMVGGIALHSGRIAEMRTGEGKTLVATLPLYLNALTGRGVHLVTVNDYLARRDARWMAPIYTLLGMTTGVLQMAARTDNGRKAFIVDLEKTSSQEDQHQLRLVLRKDAYTADITYGTNSEFGFDYLRDNLTMSLEERVQRGHYYAIIDEVDNILIDEARTPLIISGPSSDDTEWYIKMAQLVRQLNPEDYEVSEKDRSVSLTEIGEGHVELLLGQPLRDPERPEDITPMQEQMLGHLEQALKAQHLFRRNKDYLVQGGKVVIIDEFTGRLMPGRRWSEGLHQAVEAKEGVKVEPENVTYATITLQNYYRMYEKLAGMTGTALTEAEEFYKIYKLDVLPIPTNLEYEVSRKIAGLESVEAKDEQGYKYTYYTEVNDTEKKPVFWKRKDFPDVVYRTEEAKFRSIIQEALRYHVMGRPQLVGTTSVENSERISRRLSAEMIRRLALILLIRKTWMKKHNIEILDRPIEALKSLSGSIEEINQAEMRSIARELNMSMNPEEPENLNLLLEILELSENDRQRLVNVLQGGVPHQVLNARKHDEESQIIARAGAFGAVTIATNMAGRGVDIKLGGELPENTLFDINRVLSRVNPNPYDLSLDEKEKALEQMDPEGFGIYEESVRAFLQYLDEMRRVRQLGGLHVIGSERHEARRIDNQLRGRSARQGDPGSSRFYLSLEDELMRLFGGQQVEGMWKRVFFDDSLPLEMNILGRLVEQSQERVEGSNFDVRKHLLEYDDVLNAQRKRIYEQRDRVFTKANLSEDILEMLELEMQRRIPDALKDAEGPWRLLAYLEEIQPAFQFESVSYPSFSSRLLFDEILSRVKGKENISAQLTEALLITAGSAIDTEQAHLINATETMLEKAEENLDSRKSELFDILDMTLDGLDESDEINQPLRPQELLTTLSESVRMPLKLNNEQLRRLVDRDKAIITEVRSQITANLKTLVLNRVLAGLERRLEEPLAVKQAELEGLEFKDLRNAILDAVDAFYANKKSQLLGDDGQIRRDLDAALKRSDGDLLSERNLTTYLMVISQGTKLAFDQKTHRRSTRNYTRVRYVYLTARLIEDSTTAEITERILQHLQGGLNALQQARGLMARMQLIQGGVTFNQLDERIKNQLKETLGENRFTELGGQIFSALETDEEPQVVEILGEHLQNEAYRELLLRTISEQWVEYLTQMEGLRVSIGMEAYAQRDPLVQYKSRASEMFKSLLADVRMAVISRVFTYQPRGRIGSQSTAREVIDGDMPGQIDEKAVGEPETTGSGRASGKKKRRRH